MKLMVTIPGRSIVVQVTEDEMDALIRGIEGALDEAYDTDTLESREDETMGELLNECRRVRAEFTPEWRAK